MHAPPPALPAVRLPAAAAGGAKEEKVPKSCLLTFFLFLLFSVFDRKSFGVRRKAGRKLKRNSSSWIKDWIYFTLISEEPNA